MGGSASVTSIEKLTISEKHEELKNCLTYQPCTRQSQSCCQEGLITGNDRRSPVRDFSHNAIFANSVQLVVEMSDGETYLGSGTVMRKIGLGPQNQDSKLYIETCAHVFLM